MAQLNSFLGVFGLIAIAWMFSNNKRKFPLRIVIWGVALQFIFCLLILGIPILGIQGPLRFAFSAANEAIMAMIDFTLEGSRFVFGDTLLDSKKTGFIIAFQVLPTIIFMASLMAVMYQIGVMQKVIHGIAWIMQKTMKTSGAETLSNAANIFVGQTEAPILIKPFVAAMTRSELFCIMVGGMANTAGGVLAAYVGLLRDRMPDIAGHLLTASVISGPASLLIAKIIIPETEKSKTLGKIPKDVTKPIHANVIDAAANGAVEGLQLALNVATMLIAFIALVALVNAAFGHVGDWIGFADWGKNLVPAELAGEAGPRLSMQVIMGWLFAPLAWLIGIPANEMLLAGGFLGEKTVLNEFVAYVHLSQLADKMSDRTFVLLSYALCGFANFSSIAIQIGGLGGMAPSRRADLARLGLISVFGGTLCTLMIAAVVGVFIP